MMILDYTLLFGEKYQEVGFGEAAFLSLRREGMLWSKTSNYTLPHLYACCWIWNNKDPKQCWRSAIPNNTSIHLLRPCVIHGLAENSLILIRAQGKLNTVPLKPLRARQDLLKLLWVEKLGFCMSSIHTVLLMTTI